MKNIQALGNSAKIRLSLICGLIAMSAISLAQTAPDPVDYTGIIGDFNEANTTFFTSNGGLLLIGLGTFLIFGLVWRLMKRAVKSV